MGPVEIVGYITEDDVLCLACAEAELTPAQLKAAHPIFTTDDHGPDGLFCECGETIKPAWNKPEEEES